MDFKFGRKYKVFSKFIKGIFLNSHIMTNAAYDIDI